MNIIVDSTLKLRKSPWLNAQGLQAIFDCLDQSVTTTRVVGGAVRDTVQDRVVQDVDLATELTPEQVMSQATAAGFKVIETGLDHGTVTIIADGKAYEVTTLRTDIQTNGRHAKVIFGQDWAQDASRRDFTMNALYCDRFGTLLDPLQGLQDAIDGQVRFIGNADDRIAEDVLRIFRYFRFVATHGNAMTEKNTVEACGRAVNAIEILSRERIGKEMTKLLEAPRCASVLSVMADYGLIDKVIFSKQANNRLMLLESVCAAMERTPSIQARMALLGEMTGVELTTLKSSWRLPNRLIAKAIKVQDVAKFARSSDVTHFAYRAGDMASDAMIVSETLATKPNAQILRSYLFELESLKVPICPIRGEDLIALGYQPGPGFGRLLLEIENLWVASGFTLTRETLIQQLVAQPVQRSDLSQHRQPQAPVQISDHDHDQGIDQ